MQSYAILLHSTQPQSSREQGWKYVVFPRQRPRWCRLACGSSCLNVMNPVSRTLIGILHCHTNSVFEKICPFSHMRVYDDTSTIYDTCQSISALVFKHSMNCLTTTCATLQYVWLIKKINVRVNIDGFIRSGCVLGEPDNRSSHTRCMVVDEACACLFSCAFRILSEFQTSFHL